MRDVTVLTGTYELIDGKLEPDSGMQRILAKLKHLKMLGGSTEKGTGEFYYDADDNSYWHYIQKEDYSTSLARTTRSDIELGHPHIDCDRLIDVPR